jgi:alpha-beta hydrolase superfamily lysophospholipase
MLHSTGSFVGLKNVPIFTQQWLPDNSPRGVVVLAHGIAEHSGRYEHLARCLTGHGYTLHALDHRGHGQSGGPRVHVDQFDDFVIDLKTYFDQVRAAFPDAPIFLYGHSMGSLISLLLTFRRQDDLAGLITTGTALELAGSSPVSQFLAGMASRLIPMQKLIPLNIDGICTDPAVVQRYRDDPLVCTEKLRIGMVVELVRAAKRCIDQLPTLRLPYLALHGSDDPICRAAAVDLIRATSGSPDTTVKVYEKLYHEIHNEPQQDQVFEDVVHWLEAHTGKNGPH